MRRSVLAVPATAAVLAVAMPMGCSATNGRNGILSSGLAPVGSSQQGPFGTTCTIANEGIAQLTFHNTSGRNHTLKKYTITMQDQKRGQLKSRKIHFRTPISITAHTLLRQKETVTDRAVSCQVEKAHS